MYHSCNLTAGGLMAAMHELVAAMQEEVREKLTRDEGLLQVLQRLRVALGL